MKCHSVKYTRKCQRQYGLLNWIVKVVINGCQCIVKTRGAQCSALVMDAARAVRECNNNRAITVWLKENAAKIFKKKPKNINTCYNVDLEWLIKWQVCGVNQVGILHRMILSVFCPRYAIVYFTNYAEVCCDIMIGEDLDSQYKDMSYHKMFVVLSYCCSELTHFRTEKNTFENGVCKWWPFWFHYHS